MFKELSVEHRDGQTDTHTHVLQTGNVSLFLSVATQYSSFER